MGCVGCTALMGSRPIWQGFPSHQDNTNVVVEFIRKLGKVMMFGAALATNTLNNLDIDEQMVKMNYLSPFTLHDWAGIRLSRGNIS